METTPRICSIQSHVVHGYVGNKSATFPLQLLGFNVDAVNSVQFSNHTGYAKVKGQVLTDKDLDDLIDGLVSNSLDTYTHLLTGYVGSVTFLNRIANFVKHLKSKNPSLKYVCDPVMGDDGKMYVPKELLPVYKNVLIPLADILTPNQFEIELLTEMSVKTVDEAWKAFEILHEKGCKTIVLSSSNLGDKNDKLVALASSKEGSGVKLMMEIPKISASFTGTGDLFASVFLAWMHKLNNDIKVALERTVATLQAVLKRTEKYASARGFTPEHLELKLIESKNDIENPKVEMFAKEL